MFNSGLDPNKAALSMPLGIVTIERQYDPIIDAKDFNYKMDADYFAARRDRFLALRKAAIGEFDNMEATLWIDDKVIHPPQPWVRVTRHPTLGHSVVIVWRGELPGEECDKYGYLMNCNSDAVVNVYIAKMRAQGCANWHEIIAYQTHLDRAKSLYIGQQMPIDATRKAQ